MRSPPHLVPCVRMALFGGRILKFAGLSRELLSVAVLCAEAGTECRQDHSLRQQIIGSPGPARPASATAAAWPADSAAGASP